MASPEIEERLRWAERVSGEVGDLLLASFGTGVAAERKDRGVVTELDRRAEGLIALSLQDAFPGDGLLAEEGTARESLSGWCWVVDPLDGTTNYVSGLPMFAVSLACLDGRGPVLGIVRAPALGESFRAVLGAGSPEAEPPSKGPGALSDAVFIVNKAYAPAAVLWDVAGGLMQSVRAFRTFGCVSLDLALVAAGRADGLVLLPADPWDVAAGLLMVAEAGLRAGDLAGGDSPDGRKGILVTNPALFGPASGLLRPEAAG